mmetsp:Transcript_50500/g.163629  ORF Transcript_50500/g.163629 Transcript_50500/m.163629 type:complete len:298 (+) Transcript_50500:41-934(+)
MSLLFLSLLLAVTRVAAEPDISASFTHEGVDITIPPYLTKNAARCVEAYQRRPACEAKFRKLAARLLPLVGGNVIDCGSWMGDNAVPWAAMLKASGTTRRVFGFDPNPANVDFIHNLSAANGLDRHLVARIGILADRPRAGGVRNLPRVTIAQVAADAGERLGFLHLDVNGAEERVLRGAGSVLTKDRPVVATEDESGPTGTRLKRVRSLMEGLGYRGHKLPEICGALKVCRNYIWTHPDSHAGAIEEIVRELALPEAHGTPLRWCGVGDPGWGDRMRRQRFDRANASHMGVRCGGE